MWGDYYRSKEFQKAVIRSGQSVPKLALAQQPQEPEVQPGALQAAVLKSIRLKHEAEQFARAWTHIDRV